MSNLENPRFTERTSTNLGRSHRLPHACTVMIYGKLGGIACRKLLFIYIYIYIIHRNQRPIWVSLMWILEKYNDITLKRGIANLGRSHRLLCVLTISINFHKPMSVQYIFSIAGVFAVAHMIFNDFHGSGLGFSTETCSIFKHVQILHIEIHLI